MYITDSKIIEAWTTAYIADAIDGGIIEVIRATRLTHAEAKQWNLFIVESGAKIATRVETIEAIDRTLAGEIGSACVTVAEEVWDEVRTHFDVTGNRYEIIKALGEDYADVFGVARDGLEDKAKAQAAEITARRIARQTAILKEK